MIDESNSSSQELQFKVRRLSETGFEVRGVAVHETNEISWSIEISTPLEVKTTLKLVKGNSFALEKPSVKFREKYLPRFYKNGFLDYKITITKQPSSIPA